MKEPIRFTVLELESFRQEKGYQVVAFDQEGVEEEFYEWLEN